MARARTLKPGFFKNESLAECSPLARLLFAGLWTLADRAGRLEDRPKRIRAEILPYDDGSVDEMLDELQAAGFILRYQAGEQRFIRVLNFSKHQNPHCREPESAIPAPDEHSASTVQAPDEHHTSRALTLNPITHSLNPEPGAPAGAGWQEGFAKFWETYPKRKSKGQAEKAFRKINPSEQLLATILAAVEQAKTSSDWTKDAGQYIPYPASWLNAKGWEDEQAAGTSAGNYALEAAV